VLPHTRRGILPLTAKQRRQLRALGHHLEPVLIVGQSGVTEGVIAAVEQALHDHELIKVKINEGPDDRHEAAKKLAEGTNAELVQLLGRTTLLFKKREEDSEFEKL
jgi:RNA-binding protein